VVDSLIQKLYRLLFFEWKIQQGRPPLLELFIIKKKKLYKKGATTMNKAPKGSLKPEEG
jgi:hypothetical protein